MTFARDLANFADISANNITFRNIIINGGFSIDQRNGGSSQTFTAAAALAYSVDRWYGYCTGANITGARVAGAAPSQYYYRFTGATSNTAVGFGQRIEAANSFHFANKTAVLSVNLASTSITSVTWTAYYATTTDTFGTLASPTRTQIATGTFTITSTLSRYSAVMSVPAAATTGIEIVFTTGALVASQTLTFDDVQFELGSSPSAFEQRPVGTELALCQRYYEKSYPYATVPGTASTGNFGINGFSASSAQKYVNPGMWKVTKRANPDVTVYDYAGTSGKITTLDAGGTGTNNVNLAIIEFNDQGFRALGSSNGVQTGYSYHWVASSEL
jgi:hypothetical protein